MYVFPNFKTKKSLADAVKAGKTVSVFQPGSFEADWDGAKIVVVEGPHYPKPHKWYARVATQDGVVLKILA